LLLFHHFKYQTKDRNVEFDIGTNEIGQDYIKLDGNTPNE